MGRVREAQWGARVIDIDILYFGSKIISSTALSVPHPQLAVRRFVLVPLAEISPDFIHPQFQKSNAALLAACTDNLEVREFTN
jgi:2-amino-4-hydroxy-6-hydroxymethyldihydropteridine diphosphokinase